ncbi:1702_t:CDS:10 [Funneliformis geosporum]|uniref:11234_t:CDS:1 n=1 Tax=Funneliformis geosporum TaxID=1117311 RepID=A0A9W4WIM9_9GLOM|nr:11234_t:CDS:10 [Funneliformis geosporum]CAI2168330.1 1702_t:CDS:10 [Funneliformis geosporum]
MSSTTYGGDEVSAIVLDVGSCWTRAGYAGEDTPKAVFPTSYGYIEKEKNSRDSDTPMEDAASASESKPSKKNENNKYIIGDADVAAWRPNMEIKNPLVDGLIQDWDALEKIWDYAMKDRLKIDPTEHPIFVTECAWNTRDIREKLTELAFEKYNSLAFYVAKNPVLSAFAAGRPTAVVMDCGASSTSCVPVVDGYVLKKGIYKQPIAGDFLSEQLLQQLQQRFDNVVPHYKIAKKTSVDPDQPANFIPKERPNTTKSYHKYMQMRVMQEFKESVCQVSEVTYNHQSINTRPMKYFEFPDGFNTSIGALRFNIPEILFDPKFIPQPQDGPHFDTTALMGIPQMIYLSINNCDIDVRTNLWNNIILTGATTLLPGFADRVNHELSIMAPASKIKLHAAGNTIERKCSSWLGGSILSSLGTFHQLWISRKEYEENGRGIGEELKGYLSVDKWLRREDYIFVHVVKRLQSTTGFVHFNKNYDTQVFPNEVENKTYSRMIEKMQDLGICESVHSETKEVKKRRRVDVKSIKMKEYKFSIDLTENID